MPAAFFIVLEKPIRGLKSDARYPAFTAVSHKLETLAERWGIQSHMHFFDSPEESDAILEELDGKVDAPSSYVWYPADEGLAALTILRSHVEKSGKALKDVQKVSKKSRKWNTCYLRPARRTSAGV